MPLRLRNLFVTCLFLAASFAGVFTLQMLRGPRASDQIENGQIPTETTATLTEITEVSAVGVTVTSNVAAVAQTATAVSPPPPAKLAADRRARKNTAPVPSGLLADGNSAEQAARIMPSDPAIQIQWLANTVANGDSRLQRLVALNRLRAMAETGEESVQVEAALMYSTGSQDPVVADQARALYKGIYAAK